MQEVVDRLASGKRASTDAPYQWQLASPFTFLLQHRAINTPTASRAVLEHRHTPPVTVLGKGPLSQKEKTTTAEPAVADGRHSIASARQPAETALGMVPLW